jgi:hypothetical protein
MCLCRLEVSGPPAEVSRFMRAAAPVRAKGRRPRKSDPPLSFQRLLPLLDGGEAESLYGTPSEEPDDCTLLEYRRGPKMSLVSYSFLCVWSEPLLLMRHTSRQFQRLDFVLGAVAPSVGSAESWYFRKGRRRRYLMPGGLHERTYREIYLAAGVDPDETIDPELDYELDIQFDHTVMDLSVGHWTPAQRRAARKRMAG